MVHIRSVILRDFILRQTGIASAQIIENVQNMSFTTESIITIQEKAFKYDFAMVFLLMKLFYTEIVQFHYSDFVLIGICALFIGIDYSFCSLYDKFLYKLIVWHCFTARQWIPRVKIHSHRIEQVFEKKCNAGLITTAPLAVQTDEEVLPIVENEVQTSQATQIEEELLETVVQISRATQTAT